uniref:Uncharacterized protein n=1 Tax=Rhizophora mucronata TaxID=61149 RepID=A0A2P2MFI0_RHIMU
MIPIIAFHSQLSKSRSTKKKRERPNQQQTRKQEEMQLQLSLVCLTIASITFQLASPSLQSWPEQHLDSIPTPTPWPEQFHALLYMSLNSTKHLITNLWYDWPKGLNVNIIQEQLSVLLYDVEWNNGTSFYYTLEEPYTCRVMHFEVGILRPDFLDGAHYIGTTVTDGFLCNVWEKVDFIWYYEDVATKRPVQWDFFDGSLLHFPSPPISVF